MAWARSVRGSDAHSALEALGAHNCALKTATRDYWFVRSLGELNRVEMVSLVRAEREDASIAMDWTMLLANQQQHHHHHHHLQLQQQQHQLYQQHEHQLSLRPPQFNDNNNNIHVSDNNMINNNNNVILNSNNTNNHNHSQSHNDSSYHYQCDLEQHLERQEQYLPNPRGAPNGNNRNRNMTGGGRNSNSSSGNNTAIGGSISQASNNSRRRPKRIRTTFTPEQLNRLEAEFSRQIYLVGEFREFLAKSLGLSEGQVKVWFQNRRIKHRKQFG